MTEHDTRSHAGESSDTETTGNPDNERSVPDTEGSSLDNGPIRTDRSNGDRCNSESDDKQAEIDGTAIELPAELEKRIEQRISGTTFDSTEEYVLAALDQLLTVLESEEELDPETVAEESDQRVEEHLESLGYL